ncbi:hypothetical protein, partial [Gilvimarinus sp. 1_MG-2023]|uniref:hypothetical protein n=1 Tax=Gilvimarinus sp. 1_MG-2023 TaxID=3062638 RepID=UPI0026E1DDA4
MARAAAPAERLIAVSSATAADITNHWPNPEARTRVNHSGAEALPAPSRLTDYTPALQKQRYFLCVGTPEPRNNLPRRL